MLNSENSSNRAKGDEIFKQIIDEMKQSHPSTQRDWKSGGFMKMEAVVLNVSGLVNMNVGFKESHQEAFTHRKSITTILHPVLEFLCCNVK